MSTIILELAADEAEWVELALDRAASDMRREASTRRTRGDFDGARLSEDGARKLLRVSDRAMRPSPDNLRDLLKSAIAFIEDELPHGLDADKGTTERTAAELCLAMAAAWHGRPIELHRTISANDNKR